MKLSSIRLKVAMLAGIITVLLLAGTGGFLWRLTYRFNLDRLDRELRNVGSSNLAHGYGDEHWARLDEALQFIGGREEKPTYMIQVRVREREVYRSSGWPTGLDPSSFPQAGEVMMSTDSEPRPPPPPPLPVGPPMPGRPPLPLKNPVFFDRADGDRFWRIVAMGNPYQDLVIAADIGEFNADMSELRNAFLAALPVILLLAAGGSWFVAGRSLRPVSGLTRSVEGITARGLDQRISVVAHDREFERLITVFNEMMDRLESSFQQASRFSADASHELKTPLAILQGEFENALQSAPADSDEQRLMGRQLEEVIRLRGIVDKLLLLSLADVGRLPLDCEQSDLSGLVSEAVEDLSVLVPGVPVEVELETGITVQGDPHLLPQTIQNLTGNAAKYVLPSGSIRIRLFRNEDDVVLQVGNSSRPMAPEVRERVFERFFRVDDARSRAEGGAGLGLALAREIARAHGGDLVLLPSEASWMVFALTLPVGPRSLSTCV